MKIPLEFADLVKTEIEGGGQDVETDPFAEFLQDAKLAGFVGHEGVAVFKAEDAKLSAPLSKRYQEFTPRTAAPPAPSADLAKNFMSADARRRASLREYLKKSLAGGERLDEIVAYAARLEPQTAALLQEIGSEILRGVAA